MSFPIPVHNIVSYIITDGMLSFGFYTLFLFLLIMLFLWLIYTFSTLQEDIDTLKYCLNDLVTHEHLNNVLESRGIGDR